AAGAHSTCKTGAELLDATGFDDAGLGASVAGVRLGRHVTLDKGVGLPFVFDRFASVHSGAGDEFRAGLLVQEHHFAVFRVDAFFHVDSCRKFLGRQPQGLSLKRIKAARILAATYPWITLNSSAPLCSLQVKALGKAGAGRALV